MYKTLIMYFLILSVVLCGGCRKDIDAHYDRPTYLLGNTYEFLKKRGDFNLFLEAVDRSQFKGGLNGGGLFTVFVPTDEAITAYLKEIGKPSLKDLSNEELNLLIGYHIVEFSYKPSDFLGFTKTSSSEEPKEPDGYAYRFKTLARNGVVEYLHPEFGNPIKVFQKEKFLPVISTTLLKTKRSPDYEGDYKFFFPNVNWKGNKDQFYLTDASVLESGIPVDNGYVYVVDKVIKPLETVYDAFDDKPAYSLFKDLYNQFALFEYDKDATSDYASAGDSLFSFRHYLRPSGVPDLPDLSDEWTVPVNYHDFEARMRMTFNSFVPNNETILAYCNEYFANEKDPNKLPLLTLYYLLSAHVPYDQQIVLPSDFDKGVEGLFGEKWDLTKDELFDPQFCSNGLFYGIKKVLEPAIFSMITQPLFKYDRFSIMATLFHKTQNMLPLVDTDRDYTLFLLSNSDLNETYGFSLDYNGNPTSLDLLGDRIKVFCYQDWKKGDKEIREMHSGEQFSIVKSQIVEGFVDNGSQDRNFFMTKEPFTYVYQDAGRMYYEDNSPIAVVADGRFKPFEYEGGTGRGMVYEVSNKLEKEKENVAQILRQTNVKFFQALVGAGLVKFENLDENGSITTDTRFLMEWLGGERCMVFAPTNDALDESRLPTDSLVLDKYLKSHFISTDQNGVEQYILPNLGVEKTYNTKASLSLAVFETLKINFVDSKRLRLENTNKKTTYTDGEIPTFASDGLVYGIVDMIMPETLTIE